MVDKLVNRAKLARKNWWEALCGSFRLHGYKYYEIPPELRYRYPAPGSCPLDRRDHPNLFKEHWKTPYRDSPLNIRPKERRPTMEQNTEHVTSHMPAYDRNLELDALVLKEQQPDTRHIKRVECENFDPSSEAAAQELWAVFENSPKEMAELSHDYCMALGDYSADYNPVFAQFRDRDATGWGNEARLKQMFVDLEYYIEELVGAQQIKEKKVKFYKGNVKKWQILSDDAAGVDRH